MPVYQGEIYWAPVEQPDGAEVGHLHPQVVVQADVLNHSRIPTLVVCSLTTNLQRAKDPGNILLDPGEGDLPRQSVVVVSQVSTIQKSRLGAYVGALSPQRVEQILSGMRFVQSLSR